MMTSRKSLLVMCALMLHSAAMAQGSAGSSGRLEPRYLIDMPTAGMLEKGGLGFDIDFYQDGGVLLGMNIGVFDRLSFGISYGGSGLIGNGTPVMNDVPGVNVKIRIIEESMLIPALALGFDSQGKDGYIKGLDRYVIKSPGLYAAASKNYSFLGYLSFHGGANYSFERSDDDKGFNVFAGVEKTVGSFISVMVEYNTGINDNGGGAVGKGRGYVNAGIRASVGGGLTLGINLKDLLRNGDTSTFANRTAKIEFVKML